MRRLERRGVRRLRGLERAGRCEGGIAAADVGGGTIPADRAAALGELAASGLGAGSLALLAARELKRSTTGTSRDRVAVKSERESSGGASPKAAPPAAAEPLPPRPPAAIVERGGTDLTLPLLILLAVVALLLAARAVRRSGAV